MTCLRSVLQRRFRREHLVGKVPGVQASGDANFAVAIAGSGGNSRGYLEPSSIAAVAFSSQDRMPMSRNMVAAVAR